MNNLKPCPVCKTAEYLAYMDDGWQAAIRCRRCGTQAIYGTCTEDATRFWNLLVKYYERGEDNENQTLPVLQL